jgi:lipopolysaccharide export system permease protein
MRLGKSLRPNFGLSILDRYLFTELLLPLIFGILAFSSIGLAVGSLFELVRKVTEAGLNLDTALMVLLYRMPEFVSYAFPMSMLLSTLATYGRLSGDSELIALRSVGINVYRLVLPAIIVSLIVTGITFLFNEFVVPQANYQAEVTLESALESEDRANFQEENIFYQEYEEVEQANSDDDEPKSVLSRLFYAEEFDGKVMRGITLIDRSQGQIDQIITAESAIWNMKENRWDFYNGIIYVINPTGSYRNIVRFEHQELQLPRTPLDIALTDKSSSQMNITELQDWIEDLKQSGDYTNVRKLRVQLHQKIALPFICLVFGLVGSALGTRPQNKSKATSFGLSILIIFAYYLTGFITGAIGITGVIHPFWAAWIPNFLGFGAGGFLLVQSNR